MALISRFWAPISPLRRTHQEVPNPRALKSTVWATDLGILLPATQSAPASIIVPPQPLDPDIAARVNAANDWGRIRKEIAWSKRRPPAPKEMQSDWMPCSPSVLVADDLSKREPADGSSLIVHAPS
jgi:hypothetical protein